MTERRANASWLVVVRSVTSAGAASFLIIAAHAPSRIRPRLAILCRRRIPIIVFSGGGYQTFWKLTEQLELYGGQEAADRAKLWNLGLDAER